MPTIYFIEDDQSIAYVIEKTLSNAKFDYQWFQSGQPFFDAIETAVPDLILLDLMLPNESGLDHLRRLRKDPKTVDIPVIILSALATELNKVEGLDLGADDYITKPFGVLELLSRIQSKLRKQKPHNKLEMGNLKLNLSTREAAVDSQNLVLTYKEFELLKLLISNQNDVLSRDQIFSAVWESDLVLESRTIDMHIKSLRQKLQQANANISIMTIRSVGYRMISL